MAEHEILGMYQESKDYRGSIVYTQEDGYTIVTMMVSIAPDEHSSVTSHAYNLPVVEEAEHLSGIDLYHFAVPDGTRLQLIIEAPRGKREAWYTVRLHTLVADHSPIEMDIICSDAK